MRIYHFVLFLILAFTFSMEAPAQNVDEPVDDPIDEMPVEVPLHVPELDVDCYIACFEGCNAMDARPYETCRVECSFTCSSRRRLVVTKQIFVRHVDPGNAEKTIDLRVTFYILLNQASPDHYKIDLLKVARVGGSVKGYDRDGPFFCKALSAHLKKPPINAIVNIMGNNLTGEVTGASIPPIAVDVVLSGSQTCSGTSKALFPVTLPMIKGLGGKRVSTRSQGGLLAEKWKYQTVTSGGPVRYEYHWELFRGFKE